MRHSRFFAIPLLTSLLAIGCDVESEPVGSEDRLDMSTIEQDDEADEADEADDDEDADEDEDAVEEDADDDVDEEDEDDDRESDGMSSVPPPPVLPPRSSPAGSSAPLRLRMISARLDSRIMGCLFWKNLPFQSCRFRARPKTSVSPPFTEGWDRRLPGIG